MSAQFSYNYTPAIGAPGGLVDLTPHAIDTFLNEEDTGVMKFGLGVVDGTTKGTTIKKPVSGSTAAAFVGITTNNRTTEYDLDGAIYVRKAKSMGVLRYGRIYGQVAAGAAPAAGDVTYLVVSGDDAGKFTNDSSGGIEIKGRFLGGVDTATNVAAIELFNQAQEVA